MSLHCLDDGLNRLDSSFHHFYTVPDTFQPSYQQLEELEQRLEIHYQISEDLEGAGASAFLGLQLLHLAQQSANPHTLQVTPHTIDIFTGRALE